MVAGAVRAPRLDLKQRRSDQSHVHAVWLAGIDCRSASRWPPAGYARGGYPLNDNVRAQVQLSEARLLECRQAAEHILATCQPELAAATWYTPDWLMEVLRGAAQAFERSFDRWRELYRMADQQWEEANRVLRHPVKDRALNRDAETPAHRS